MGRAARIGPWAAALALALAGWAVAPRGLAGLDLGEVGRRIYDEGVLPDGSPLRASRPGGFELSGALAACATCHRRSGMGSVEGSLERAILVPPIAGPALFSPARFAGTYLNRDHHWVPNDAWARALTRSAYDEASLARALRHGLDPDGRPLRVPMLEYDLNVQALSALTAYLRQLGADPSPGVEAEVLHLATVIAPDAPPDQAEAVLGVLRAWSGATRASGRAWRLHVWTLSGPEADWPAQLAARYAEQPALAILSGAGGSRWSSVHRFCEAQRLPCLFPALEAAPSDEAGTYSMYFSPGVPLESRLLARHLQDGSGAQGGPRRVVQVIADDAGARAAQTLSAALDDAQWRPLARRFHPTAPLTALAGLEPSDVLVLWLRPESLSDLAPLAPSGPVAEQVFLSHLLAPPEALRLPPAWKARLSVLSLFDDFTAQGQIAQIRLRQWLRRSGLPAGPSLRVQGDAYTAAYLLAAALSEIRAQELRRPPVPLSREHLLETLETLVNKYNDGTGRVDPDSHVAHYGRMSLGPQQRTAVHGGALLRYAAPDSDRLVPASERILP